MKRYQHSKPWLLNEDAIDTRPGLRVAVVWGGFLFVCDQFGAGV